MYSSRIDILSKELLFILTGGAYMDSQAIGNRIKAAREARGLTQEALAGIVDLSTTHMSVIERGIKSPRLETFVALANALDVSADDLLIDVVNKSTISVAGELDQIISKLPRDRKQRILKAVRALVE